jgi:hypothetical protein
MMMNKTTFLLILLMTLFSGCLVMNPKKQNNSVHVIVTYVHREENNNEVWVRHHNNLYRGMCSFIPDSIKLGLILEATYINPKDNCECKCVFKRIKQRHIINKTK